MLDKIKKWIKKEKKGIERKSYGQEIWNSLTPIQRAILFDQIGNGNAYQKLAIAYTCIHRTSVAVASQLPVVLEDSNGELIDISKDPAANLFFNRPNDDNTPFEFLERITADLQRRGNAYILVVGTPKRPIDLKYIFPEHMEVVPVNYAQRNVVDHYRDLITGTRYLKEEIIHIKMYKPMDNTEGQSWLSAGAEKLLRAQQFDVYNNSILEKGVFPGMMFTSDQHVAEENYYRFKDQLKAYAGSGNAGLPFIGDMGLKPVTFSFTPADMEIIESENVTARSIAVMLGHPPGLLSLQTIVNRATYEEMRKQYITETVLPTMNRILSAINYYFYQGKNMKLRVNERLIDVLRRPAADLKEAYWLTTEQKRIEDGFRPSGDPNLDVYLVPKDLLPLREVVFSGSEDVL